MIKPNYYTVSIFNPVISQETKYKTLREAKIAVLHFSKIGVKLCSHFIYGKCKEDEDISLTYTPFYCDTKTFGRTKTTMYGNLIKQGRYKL